MRDRPETPGLVKVRLHLGLAGPPLYDRRSYDSAHLERGTMKGIVVLADPLPVDPQQPRSVPRSAGVALAGNSGPRTRLSELNPHPGLTFIFTPHLFLLASSPPPDAQPSTMTTFTLAAFKDRPLPGPESHCTFCSISSGSTPAHIVYESQHCLAFLDILPIRKGHLLVVPRRHVDNVAGLDVGDGTGEEVGEMMRAVVVAARGMGRGEGLRGGGRVMLG